MNGFSMRLPGLFFSLFLFINISAADTIKIGPIKLENPNIGERHYYFPEINTPKEWVLNISVQRIPPAAKRLDDSMRYTDVLLTFAFNDDEGYTFNFTRKGSAYNCKNALAGQITALYPIDEHINNREMGQYVLQYDVVNGSTVWFSRVDSPNFDILTVNYLTYPALVKAYNFLKIEQIPTRIFDENHHEIKIDRDIAKKKSATDCSVS